MPSPAGNRQAILGMWGRGSLYPGELLCVGCGLRNEGNARKSEWASSGADLPGRSLSSMNICRRFFCDRKYANSFALPERRVTLHSGDMGNTFSLCGRELCPGRSVVSWKNVFDSLPACWTARRWPASAVSSALPARPATRSTPATRTAAWTGCPTGAGGRIGMPTRVSGHPPGPALSACAAVGDPGGAALCAAARAVFAVRWRACRGDALGQWGTQQLTRARLVTLATWARAVPWQQVARLFRCSWGTVATAVEAAVAYGLAHRDR